MIQEDAVHLIASMLPLGIINKQTNKSSLWSIHRNYPHGLLMVSTWGCQWVCFKFDRAIFVINPYRFFVIFNWVLFLVQIGPKNPRIFALIESDWLGILELDTRKDVKGPMIT